MSPLSPQDTAKQAAGRQAAELCEDGMRLGLGSGTTSHFFVRALAERVARGLDVVGVPTSSGTRDLALELGVKVGDLNDLGELDLCVDGADELTRDGLMIKGGGACLLREKIVARAAARMVVVADAHKVVDGLGAFPLPIEVLPFGWMSTRRLVVALLTGAGYQDPDPVLRVADGRTVVTDNGNFLLDVELGRIDDAAGLTVELNRIPGVLENGLFVGVASSVVLGRTDGTAQVAGLPLAASVVAGPA